MSVTGESPTHTTPLLSLGSPQFGHALVGATLLVCANDINKELIR